MPSATAFADTWEWDGENWTQIADTGPDGRSAHALAFDSGRNRLVLFGGVAADASFRGDTWEWDGENWTQIADTGPDARSGHGFAFDSGQSLTVLFGGRASGASLRGDTWAWDGSNWTQQQDVGPAAREGHGLAFDSVRSQLLLYGGDTGDTVVGDTWTWDGAQWTEHSHFGPPACVDATLVFDGGSALLYGGVASLTNAAAQVFAGSWAWDGQHWTQRQDIGPGPRWGHAMAFDSVRGRTVLYGGASVPPADANVASQLLGDTWEAQGTPMHSGPDLPSGLRIGSFTTEPGAGPMSVILHLTLTQVAPSDIVVPVTAERSDGVRASPTMIRVLNNTSRGDSSYEISPAMAPDGLMVFSASLGNQTFDTQFPN